MKTCTKNSLKKLTFATLRTKHFQSFFCKFGVIAILFTMMFTDSEKIVHFLRKGYRLPTCLSHTGKAQPILLLISSRGKHISLE